MSLGFATGQKYENHISCYKIIKKYCVFKSQ